MPTVAKSRPVTPLSILAARLERLAERVGANTPLDAALKGELDEIAALAGGLDPYLSRCTTPESPALRALAERTRAIDWSRVAGDGAGRSDGTGAGGRDGAGAEGRDAPALEAEMLSGHVEGQALKFLVALSGARRVLEIGMFTGYSALAMAEALPEDGELLACELDPEVADFARDCFAESPSGAKIAVEVGPALATLARLAAERRDFDLVFIDADKAGYRDYLDAVLGSGLLARGGVICIDNTLMQGEPYLDSEPSANGAAIAAFNGGLADDPRVEQVLLPLRDGLTLVRRA